MVTPGRCVHLYLGLSVQGFFSASGLAGAPCPPARPLTLSVARAVSLPRYFKL